MNTSGSQENHDPRHALERKVAQKQEQKIRARRAPDRSAWFGLGMFGLVGWSVAVPALVGVAIGLWVDSRLPSRFSWTVMLLVIGVAIGCLNAWWWVQRESRENHED